MLLENNMNIPWIVDPKTKETSVSLTLLVVCFAATIIAAGLQVAGVVQTTGIFMELNLSCIALYFGRKINFGGKTYSSEQAEEIKSKVE